MVAAEPLARSYDDEALKATLDLPLLSGLKGKAMFVEKSDIPTKKQIRDAVPSHCFTRITWKSMIYAAKIGRAHV